MTTIVTLRCDVCDKTSYSIYGWARVSISTDGERRFDLCPTCWSRRSGVNIKKREEARVEAQNRSS